MEELELCCRRVWLTDDGQGGRRDFVLEVFAPEPDGADARCQVAVDGERMRVYGVDSWQAVTLALRFLRIQVEDLERRGLKLYWQDGTPATAADLDL
ncbi:hypothetical protein IP92_01730 [Pseudoduganella flava]|uniref:DUF6968 domain-containing protein n=1 Tax=Pseudoduganella flava TaxID=871742 RepID=A0A562PV61_9BURK|nr:hypothetical protein [Pseudoduganella flava]QGZ39459.1 hypothetical protein GO485_10645 [Pseudoduganella flava]TWI48342.1 hypothetical protein IP92_01730 [Pseudoduganella flava]